jgi:transposase
MAKAPTIAFEDLGASQLEALLERIRPLIGPQDFQLLQRLVATFRLILELIQKQATSLRRLRQMIFGPKTEKSSQLLPKAKDTPADSTVKSTGTDDSAPPKRKKKGHGRNGALDYPGAQRVSVPHPTLQAGCPCPLCQKGRLYELNKPALVIRIVAQPIFPATIYELMRLRCNSCLMVFTAPTPAEAGTSKYSEEVPAMLAILRYGSGVPQFRIQVLQQGFGVPLPTATQWELLRDAAHLLMPVWQCLLHLAAQAWLFYHDDTRMKVLSLLKDHSRPATNGRGSKERTGIFTTGILAQVDEHRIALFFTGHKHAGENLEHVLEQRAPGLPAPIQMSDGLSANQLKTAQTDQANCNTHARRKYAEVVDAFPQECRFVLETLQEVYQNDGRTKQIGLSPQERLHFHQVHSQKPMEELERWAREQIEQKKVEPNSGLGQAIRYMLKRWEKLTLFLRKAGVPLDNNLCEQIIKRAILHRKNSMFYRNEQGAMVGDLYMSLIETCRCCGANPLEYLTALLKHTRLVSENPEQWLPWNFRIALAAADTS